MQRKRNLRPVVQLIGLGACASVLAYTSMVRNTAIRQPGAEITVAVADAATLIGRSQANERKTDGGSRTARYACAMVLHVLIADLGFRCRRQTTKTAAAPNLR